MSFGLVVKNGAGQVMLSVTDPALRVIYRRSLAVPDAGSHPLPGFNAGNADAYVISREMGKRSMSAWMTDGAVNWGYDSWWPAASAALGDLVVVARK